MLASIQKILEVSPIEGADKIERVKVLGWDCVVRKNIFKEGDLCIYIEIDTIVPKQLLDDNYEGEEMVRLRTVKMRKQISQGLVLSPTHPYFLSRFKFLKGTEEELNHFIVEVDQEQIYIENYDDGYSFIEGQDVTTELGIKKYEKAIPKELQGIAKGNFPSFLQKTDEVRIQSSPKFLDQLKGKPYYITTKIDGTSATFYKYNGEFGVCSRNLDLEEGDNLYWKMAKKYKIMDWLPDGYAIQGEICGEGIQKNPLKLEGQELYVFNVYNINEHKYMSWDFITGFLSYSNKVNTVPLEKVGNDFNYSLEELLEKAQGYYSSGKRKEGIVIRALDQSISFKVLNNEFLLKDEE